jgi:lipopolysaccharide biosynthesis glycosyltransferase
MQAAVSPNLGQVPITVLILMQTTSILGCCCSIWIFLRRDVILRALAYTCACGHMLRHENQDGLNAVLAGNWGKLDPRCNLLLCLIRQQDHREDADYRSWIEENMQPYQDNIRILHFCEQVRAWNTGLNSPLRFSFFRYLTRSSWFRLPQYYL